MRDPLGSAALLTMPTASMPRFSKNAEGPFYTTGECLACGAPEAEASTLLAELADQQLFTFFVRQPTTPQEIEAACRAAQVCCVSSLRYGGRDPSIIKRLGNTPEFCDHIIDASGAIVDAPLPWPPPPPTRWDRFTREVRRLWRWIAYGAT